MLKKSNIDVKNPQPSVDMNNSCSTVHTVSLKQAVCDHLIYSLGKLPVLANKRDYYKAMALAVRDRLQKNWVNTLQNLLEKDAKAACYLSAEFLMGPHLGNNLLNLGIESEARQVARGLGFELDELLAEEEEPGLGNGGPDRLAACYPDSLATLERPAAGYRIRYEFGIFDQEIRDGWQCEITDKWLHGGNPWEIAKPDICYYVNFGGRVERYQDQEGGVSVRWVPGSAVKGMAYDTSILGYRVNNCNTLRLWSSEACESFDFQRFNSGDYYAAVNDKVVSGTLTKVPYPNDEPEAGKRLRLAQQYFFVSCSLQDMLRILDVLGLPPRHFPDKFAVQLKDTHPSIAVAELMRLQDEYRPSKYIEQDAELADAIKLIGSGHFSYGDEEVFRSVVENPANHDPFMVCADYGAYLACQDEVNAAWKDQEHWTRMSILNTARAGKFSSDRAIREYCDEIWQVPAVPMAGEGSR